MQNSVIILGDSLAELKKMPNEIAQSIITSPPYWGIRDYGIPGQIGNEARIEDYLSRLTGVFFEARRVLKRDGVMWLVVGDTFTSGNRSYREVGQKYTNCRLLKQRPLTPAGLKRKDLIGLPWRLAFALQQSGWYLRSDIVWNKTNSMPESVCDRPTRTHEYIFMLTKSENYFYDYKQILEKGSSGRLRRKRSVWSVGTNSRCSLHSATFPVNLISPCILATTRENDCILDPFFGVGTVGIACVKHNRRYIGIEISQKFISVARDRLSKATKVIQRS